MMVHTTVDEHGICHNFAKREVMIPYQWSLLVVFMIIPVCVVSTFYGCIIKFLLDQTRNNIVLSRDDIKVTDIIIIINCYYQSTHQET